MTSVEALRALTTLAQAALKDGETSLQVDPELLSLAKNAVVPEGTYPPDLADVPIFLDASGILTIARVSLF